MNDWHKTIKDPRLPKASLTSSRKIIRCHYISLAACVNTGTKTRMRSAGDAAFTSTEAVQEIP